MNKSMRNVRFGKGVDKHVISSHADFMNRLEKKSRNEFNKERGKMKDFDKMPDYIKNPDMYPSSIDIIHVNEFLRALNSAPDEKGDKSKYINKFIEMLPDTTGKVSNITVYIIHMKSIIEPIVNKAVKEFFISKEKLKEVEVSNKSIYEMVDDYMFLVGHILNLNIDRSSMVEMIKKLRDMALKGELTGEFKNDVVRMCDRGDVDGVKYYIMNGELPEKFDVNISP